MGIVAIRPSCPWSLASKRDERPARGQSLARWSHRIEMQNRKINAMTLQVRFPELVLKPGAALHHNLGVPQLIEHAVKRGEGRLSEGGALAVETGRHTGRSAQDKFIVKDLMTEEAVWWGSVNKPMTKGAFERLKEDFFKHIAELDNVFVQDLFGGSQAEHRINVRVVTELAWHSSFVRTMLVRGSVKAIWPGGQGPASRSE